MLSPNYELQQIAEGYDTIVGIDEVGRGCWAGPVTVGAYFYQVGSPHILGVNDSKLLSLKQRVAAFAQLQAHQHSVMFGSVADINELGIGKTIEQLITGFITEFTTPTTLFLVDGQFKTAFASNVRKFIKGDSTYYSIAAASILAKVQRDRLMAELDQHYPLYGFARHKGYGTKQHQQALTNHGVCEIHRLSYKNIALMAQ
jgi:ribonuclease HII